MRNSYQLYEEGLTRECNKKFPKIKKKWKEENGEREKQTETQI